MKLSNSEKKELESLCEANALVSKLWEEVKRYEEDVRARFLLTLNNTVKALCDDMDKVTMGKFKECKILNRDDRVFERVMTISKESKNLFAGLNEGRSIVSPTLKTENEKHGSRLAV